MKPVNTHVKIVQAQSGDADDIARLAYAMEAELWDGDTGGRTEQQYQEACQRLLTNGDSFWALVAQDHAGDVVGMVTISQCAALYAGGLFGEIMEFYVEPPWRSQGCGQALIAAAKSFAVNRGWPFLEVGAPPQPRWQKTLDFYHKQGFRDIGPRLEWQIQGT